MKTVWYSLIGALVFVVARFIWFQLRYGHLAHDLAGTLLIGGLVFVVMALILAKALPQK